MARQNQPKNQHYVAQLYLRQFAFERGKNPRLHVFDKTAGRALSPAPSVRSMAAGEYFYDRENAEAIERIFQSVEQPFIAPYRRLIDGDSPASLRPDERAAVVLYVAMQLVRTKEQRETLAAMMDATKRALATRELSAPQYTDYDDAALRAMHVQMLPNLCAQTGTAMAMMKWTVLTNDTTLPFWTCDHPVARFNPRPTDGLTGNLGLLCNGIMVVFPLSPRRVLAMLDPVAYANAADVAAADDEDVSLVNRLMVVGSTRYVFSNQHDFLFAHKVLGEQPWCAAADRRRIEVD